MNVDYKKLEVIVVHKPDLRKVEIEWLKSKGYCDKIKDTLFKVTTHEGVALEENNLFDWGIDASYSTTGYAVEETYNYCYETGYSEDYLLYLTGQVHSLGGRIKKEEESGIK